jgi:uncharacterized membrane protein
MNLPLLVVAAHALEPQFNFPQGSATELIVLRWLHFIFGTIWIGLLYFFNLVGFPTMKQLDAAVRGKVYPVMMSRAMNWFRWSALITVLVGLRYYFTILSADAHNSGNPSLTLRWFGWWLLVWLAAYALIYPFQLPSKGILDNPWVRTIAIAVIVMVASWIVLDLNSGPQVSNAHLCISVGGGLGFLMLMNTWVAVSRVPKGLIDWSRACVEQCTTKPQNADRLSLSRVLQSRAGFWLSFPMLFFMGAAEHYPFLSSIAG